MIEDAGISALLTHEKWLEALSPTVGTGLDSSGHVSNVFCLDRLHAAISAQSVADFNVLLAPDDVAYIMYSSGSTGKPKGCAVPHRQILNRLAWMWEAYPFGPHEVGCQKTALSFVDSIWELFGYLLQGIPTIVIPDTDLKDLHKFVTTLAESGVTRLWLVPSLLRVLVNTFPDLQQRLPQLTFWVTSGEALPLELAQRFQAALPHAALYNLYGTSEVWDAIWFDPRVATLADIDYTSVPIGRPIANIRTYILNRNLQPAPIGVYGELYVGGIGVGYGYLNCSSLTAERFLPDPFCGEVDARMYRSGDLARYLSNGEIEFLGRNDFQVKIRGFRIELEEIESVLNQYPAIAVSAVAVHQTGTASERLVAFYVTKPDCQTTGEELRRYLAKKLPGYMVPGAYIAMERLPHTPSGKVNRKLLLVPDELSVAAVQTFVAPRDELELMLVNIWENVLGVRGIGVTHDFFELGGHSLLAVRLFSLIEEHTGHKLPLTTLFEAPTIGRLAEILRAQQWRPAWKSLVPINPGGSKLALFMVPPAAATSLRFAALVGRSDSEQPVYGLDPLGMDGNSRPQDRVEDMAAHYISEIRQLKPSGPYLVGGMCFGGHVALEMACQLVEQGEDIPLLIIVDSMAPFSGPNWSKPRNAVDLERDLFEKIA